VKLFFKSEHLENQKKSLNGLTLSSAFDSGETFAIFEFACGEV